ncbi:ImmA/IrrE family metallo-endopeptidase [Microvirga tunisiensis]|uniref:ImmA/IrrE family metallo-endopeptidase n=1 Tax=Pannonibacter tanglangensis TaxID=2750084 RepID=A0A7X5F1A1_9HYPH|nr:ImmA/IrrE family metallo-endopeptidase [Pannonibacter sp. XCT-53]NBN77918.1 ImmA/IrrE family metallo-endopeptidase [Pannonibacter sp. XCT-53]
MEVTALSLTAQNAKQRERDLRLELSGIGVEWKSLKRVLPDWVDSAFQSRSGVVELKTFLSRNAGLQLSSEGLLTTKQLPAACFKTNSATSVEQVTAARNIATACARLIAMATKTPYKHLPDVADTFREKLLRNSNKRWIDLPMLLNACWEHGVPVLYLPSLPVQGRKMEGMVTFVRERPAIILTKKVPHPDWLLFVLAHEIGHLAKGHLPEDEGQAIVDDTVEIKSGEERDQQEEEANMFATHLLAPGGKEVTIRKRLPVAAKFADEAKKYGQENGIAPGYVILNAVHNSLINGKKPFALGQAALKLIPTDNDKCAADLCKDALRENIDQYVLRDDSVDFLEKLDLL